MVRPLNKFLLITIIILTSCANTTKTKREKPHPDFLAKVNYFGDNRTGTVTLINNERFKANKIRITNDSLICINSETQTRNSFSIYEVKKVSFKDRFVSSVYGCLIGCSIGLGLAGGSTEPFPVQNVLIIGSLAGAIPGYLIGSDLNFVFVDDTKK
jgi:hypothetical protein